MDNIESKSGEMIILGRLDKFFTVSRKEAGEFIAMPMDVFETRSEALDFAKKYLADHPDAGFVEAICDEMA